MVIFVVLGGEETVVTSVGYCRCIEMVVGNGGVRIRPRKGLHPRLKDRYIFACYSV